MSSRSAIRVILFIVAALLIAGALKFASLYRGVFSPNLRTPDHKPFYLLIPTGADYQEVLDSIAAHKLVKNTRSFDWVAKRKKYPERVKPGRYKVTPGMSNAAFVNMLRSGTQAPVNVVINIARTPEDLALRISKQIEAPAEELTRLMRDPSFLKGYGFTRETILGMFIPNTYEFWWNTGAETFFKRMNREYEKFWKGSRDEKASRIGLDRNGVITLASILINETNEEAEYRRMAGVYVNRLNRGIPLQADPTVKFALGDYERKRILKKDTQVDSPYNTYIHEGLPPGPIALPTVSAIDAVLDHEHHDYLYFCAREDFSGYHNFARTLDQHNKNARSYQKALNRRNILH
jgi:UPF0755 protein